MTDPGQRRELEAEPRFRASPHHGFRGWLTLALQPGQIDWAEISQLLASAYRAVASKELVAEMDRESGDAREH